VLIHTNANAKEPSKGLIVSDAITGSQQHLIAPSYYFCNYMGLCCVPRTVATTSTATVVRSVWSLWRPTTSALYLHLHPSTHQ
jgi:hypothetical protein